MKRITNYIIGCCLTLTNLAANAQIGSLDNTFGAGGKITTDIGGFEDNVNDMVIQSDGKIIVVGNFAQDANGASYDCFLARYNSDGTLDNSFGTGGKVITDFGNNFEGFNAIALQTDGKIVVTGSTDNSVTHSNIILARYTTNGTLDNAFGTGGKVTTDFGNGDSDEGNSIAIQSDGKILVGGETNTNNNNPSAYFDMAVICYTSSGNLDNTFGTNGLATADFGNNNNEYVKSIALQSDGKIVIAGFYNGIAPNYTDFAVARFNSNGTLDNSFDTDGQLTTDFGTSGDNGNSITIQSDGKIIVAGYNDNGSNAHFAMARYNTNGSLDNAFGSNGKVITQVSTYTDKAYSAALQVDGKIVIGGWGFITGVGNGFALVRYNSDGSIDNSFGTAGKATTTFGFSSPADYAYSLAIQSDGKIVLAGISHSGFTTSSADIAISRYNVTGSTGLVSIYSNNVIDIYPNPSTGIFNCTSTGTISAIKIFNMLGENIYSEKINSQKTEINLINVPKGVYFYQVEDTEKILKIAKIIIE